MRFGIILSAGKGTRMNSEISKGLFPLNGKPFIEYSLETFKQLNLNKCVVVLGYKKEEYEPIKNKFNFEVAIQQELNGTAKAVLAAKSSLFHMDGETLIVPVDSPIVSKELYEELFKYHESNNFDMTILSTTLDNPHSYGRMVRDEKGNFLAIREELDCSDEERKITEINGGIYVVNNKILFDYLELVGCENKKHEYYFTDLAKILLDNGLKVGAYKTDRKNELLSINDQEMLKTVEKVIKES